MWVWNLASLCLGLPLSEMGVCEGMRYNCVDTWYLKLHLPPPHAENSLSAASSDPLLIHVLVVAPDCIQQSHTWHDAVRLFVILYVNQ
jgi:hypothetical protein